LLIFYLAGLWSKMNRQCKISEHLMPGDFSERFIQLIDNELFDSHGMIRGDFYD